MAGGAVNKASALAHTAAKPGRGPIEDLIVYRVEIARSKLRRYRRGIWRTFETVRPISVESPAFTPTLTPLNPEPGELR